jgi:hypothetical protein
MDVNEIGNEWLNSTNDNNAETDEPRTDNNTTNNNSQIPGTIQLSARSVSDTSTIHETMDSALANQTTTTTNNSNNNNSNNNNNPSFISHQDLLRQQAHAPVSFTTSRNHYLHQQLASLSTLAGSISTQSTAQNTTTTTTTMNNNNSVPLHLPRIRSVPRIEDLNISTARFGSRGPPPEAEMDHNVGSSPVSSTASVSGWSLVTENNGGAPPPTRSLHAAAVLNKVMYVFGGYDGSTRVNTFHAYSFAEKRWSPVHAIGGPPGPRDRHVAFAFGFQFYVHGGFNGTSRVSDFWGFDLSSMTWREVVVLGGRPPSPRHSHSAVVHRHSLYIYGGYDGSYSTFCFSSSLDASLPGVYVVVCALWFALLY